MNQLYHRADTSPSKAILVVYRIDTAEGLRSLRRLVFGWPGLRLFYLDENHIVAVLNPGGALGLPS